MGSSMNSMLRWILLALAIVLTFSETSAKPTASAEGGQPGEINSALNYLAELDKYYSNVARPRLPQADILTSNNNPTASQNTDILSLYPMNNYPVPQLGKRSYYIRPRCNCG